MKQKNSNETVKIAELPAPIFVAAQSELDTLLQILRAQSSIAVDTESNSLFAYEERVCLIQFSTDAHDYIVDPLALQDISPLAAIFADARIEKVFHAAEYDLIGLRRDFNWDVENVFDTMIAARTLGWPRVGLASILENEYGVKLNKRFQRADWGQRPLSKQQLAYARMDTHYLLRMRERLANDLRANDQFEEAREEFERIRRSSLRSKPEKTDGPHPDGFWRISGARDLNGKQAAILRELYLYRERAARKSDRPPFKVIGNEILIAIARKKPRVTRELESIKGMTPRQLRRHGESLIEAVKTARSAPKPKPPSFQRVDEDILQRYEALHQWRKKRARKRGVESDIILAREVLWDLARTNPTTLAELESISELGAWRRKNYGLDILNVLAEQS